MNLALVGYTIFHDGPIRNSSDLSCTSPNGEFGFSMIRLYNSNENAAIDYLRQYAFPQPDGIVYAECYLTKENTTSLYLLAAPIEEIHTSLAILCRE